MDFSLSESYKLRASHSRFNVNKGFLALNGVSCLVTVALFTIVQYFSPEIGSNLKNIWVFSIVLTSQLVSLVYLYFRKKLTSTAYYSLTMIIFLNGIYSYSSVIQIDPKKVCPFQGFNDVLYLFISIILTNTFEPSKTLLLLTQIATIFLSTTINLIFDWSTRKFALTALNSALTMIFYFSNLNLIQNQLEKVDKLLENTTFLGSLAKKLPSIVVEADLSVSHLNDFDELFQLRDTQPESGQKSYAHARKGSVGKDDCNGSRSEILRSKSLLGSAIRTVKFDCFSPISDESKANIESQNWISAIQSLKQSNLPFDQVTTLGLISYRRSKILLLFLQKDSTVGLFALNQTNYLKQLMTNLNLTRDKRLVDKFNHEVKNPVLSVINTAKKLVLDSRPASVRTNSLSIIQESRYIIFNLQYFYFLFSYQEKASDTISADFYCELSEIEEIFTYQAQKTQGRVKFALEVDPSLSEELSFPYDLLKMSLFLLIHNAFKFTGSGKILLKVAKEQFVRKGLETKTTVSFEVKDEGSGVSDEVRNRLFLEEAAEITNTNSYGIGNGLFIAAKLVKEMGASLVHSDNAPRGSVFRFSVTSEMTLKEDSSRDSHTVKQEFDPREAHANIWEFSKFKETVHFDKENTIGTVEITRLRSTQDTLNKFKTRLGVTNIFRDKPFLLTSEKSTPISRKKPRESMMNLRPRVFLPGVKDSISSECKFSDTLLGREDWPIPKEKYVNITRHFINDHLTEEFVVIITDDEAANRECSINLLRDHFTKEVKDKRLIIFECTDGLETLVALFYMWKQNNSVDLILTDENMEFVTGSLSINVIHELNQGRLHSSPKIAIITAFNSNEEAKLLLEDEIIEAVIPKPLTKHSLKQIL